MDMADLEPNVLLVEWFRWIFDNVCKALLMHQEKAYIAQVSPYFQALLKLLLLLVDDAKSEVNLIGLFKVWLHAHDLREGLFGVLQGAIAVVQNANAIPEFGFLQRLVPGQAKVFSDEPLGLVNSIEPVGMLYTPPADCPSLGSSGLVEVSDSFPTEADGIYQDCPMLHHLRVPL